MSQEQHTRFQLTFNGISLELHGEKDFVEEMYREVMSDVEEARARNARGDAPQVTRRPDKPSEPGRPGQKREPKRPIEHVIWIHRCTALVNKIYMASPTDVRKSKALEALFPEQVATLYVEGELLSKIMPQFDRGQTLWAELTTAGRKKIAEASDPKRARGTQTSGPNTAVAQPGRSRTPTTRGQAIGSGIKGASSTTTGDHSLDE